MGSKKVQVFKTENNRDIRKNVRLKMDLLSAFETADFYDCTIRVGCDLHDSNTTFKDFKCHKIILSACSLVFKIMFSPGTFKEAKLGPDEPIQLDKIDPLVFESAMRFVYGQVRDFKSFYYATKLYKFAHEMQIESLTEALLDDCLQQPNASEVFALFDAYLMTNNQKGLAKCKEILEMDTTEAIGSSEWLKISSESVEEFLSMEFLNIYEADLIRALMRWGEFQLLQQGAGNDDLRSKILPGLQKIRFASLSQQEMAQLCKDELREVMSADEKCHILMSIITKDWKPIRTEFVPLEISPSPRHNQFVTCFFSFDKGDSRLQKSGGMFATTITFEIDKRALIVGLKLKKPVELSAHKSISFSLFDNKQVEIAKGSTEIITSTSSLKSVDDEVCKINALRSLNANTKYHLCLNFHCDKSCFHTLQKLNKTFYVSYPTLKVSSQRIDAHVEGLFFQIKKPV